MALLLLTYRVPENIRTQQLLLAAAEKRNIEVNKLMVDELAIDDVLGLKFTNQDLLYRTALGEKAKTLEMAVVMRKAGESPKNFFMASDSYRITGVPWIETLTYAISGVPIIPTLFMDSSWKRMSDEELTRRLDTINGFPVVVKQEGLSHGRGVALLNTLEDLKTFIKMTDDEHMQRHALRQYLDSYRHARLIVLGDKVIDSIEYFKPENDFRTNAAPSPTVKPMKFDGSVEKIALDASVLEGRDYGGVDVLIDEKTNKAYLAEFNSPCNFARSQDATGVDIAGQILDYLTNK